MKYTVICSFALILGCKATPTLPHGGFDYPEHVDVKDTNLYFYQIKDIESKRDAFYDAYAYFIYRPLNEPNLSIRPAAQETIRLTYGGAMRKTVVISVTASNIIVKSGYTGNIYSEDTSLLTPIENLHLKLLRRRFPIDTSRAGPRLKRYLDSMTILYPQLLDPVYYHTLYDKVVVTNKDPFTYEKTTIPLTRLQFDSLRSEINSSGFWSSSYSVNCQNLMMDGYGFTLEINTNKKYQVVQFEGYPDDTSKITRTCQTIIRLAQLDKQIDLVWKSTIDTLATAQPNIKEANKKSR